MTQHCLQGNSGKDIKCQAYANLLVAFGACQKKNTDGDLAGYSTCGYTDECVAVKDNGILNQCISKENKLCEPSSVYLSACWHWWLAHLFCVTHYLPFVLRNNTPAST